MNCSYLEFNFRRLLGPELPSQATLEFLTHRIWENKHQFFVVVVVVVFKKKTQLLITLLCLGKKQAIPFNTTLTLGKPLNLLKTTLHHW